MRGCFIRDADDLSKIFDPMGFSLSPEWLAHVLQRFGPWDVGRYASPSNATAPPLQRVVRLGSRGRLERRDERLARDGVVRPAQLQRVEKILDNTERDDAGAALVVPEWPYRTWW